MAKKMRYLLVAGLAALALSGRVLAADDTTSTATDPKSDMAAGSDATSGTGSTETSGTGTTGSDAMSGSNKTE